MFCPKCGKEYRKDIYICAKCRVSLVPELLQGSTNESQELVEFEEILFTPSSGDMALIKSLLESEGIVYRLRGEFFSSEHRYVQPARLMVHTDRVEEVKEILESLNITYNLR
jgi:hypothetical protein